ncbi:DUF2059 domain-containing protein [Erythrobacter sp. YT30]|uniref:DUF2059 domain-containing protein n=1 Tax=Erythrobacter sp. YT30 TaxID=1735012 RepID=UPI00076C46FD|nr:DUF2059 domain-containing protein [Erythrobacter sp. YT30]KWV91270.1 hypothetical protein AUC45_08255 [Erythrobacter sp. YT30]
MKRTILAAASGFALALSAIPAAAQESEPSADEMEQMMAGLSEAFPTEPLTADQEARLPQATRIVGLMIPEGSMAEMMGTMFDDLLGPLSDAAGGAAVSAIAEGTGLTTFELDLEKEQAAELALLFDPAWEERRARESKLLPEMMGEVMSAMEPSMRKAMSELYAINFNDTELAEIEAFFLTDTGASFARKSFTMSSDPRIIGASMEVMPQMMETFMGMETRIAEATADLPEKRAFADLSAEEKAKVAEATGYSVEEIEGSSSATEAAWDEDYDYEEEAVETEEADENN